MPADKSEALVWVTRDVLTGNNIVIVALAKTSLLSGHLHDTAQVVWRVNMLFYACCVFLLLSRHHCICAAMGEIVRIVNTI